MEPTTTATTRSTAVTAPPNVVYVSTPPRGSVTIVRPHPPTERPQR